MKTSAAAESIAIQTADGMTLRGSLHRTSGDHALIINSAMGVKRRYYDAFAAYAAERGVSVVTYDYRGIGESRPRSVRGFPATMTDWGTLDIPAVIAWTKRELRPRTISMMGHSAGGQLIGLAPNAAAIDRIVLVASQSGSYRLWPPFKREALGTFWFVMPLVSRIVGYFPSPLFGLGSENLPHGVASEWSRWGRSRDYLFDFHDASGYEALRVPLLAWSFADDQYAPRVAVESLLTHYTAATIDHRHVEPRGIKHFGFFRRALGGALWDETVDWLATPRNGGGVRPKPKPG